MNHPDTGYRISLYFEFTQAIPECRQIIERTRKHIKSQQAYLADCERNLSNMESTVAWMQENQADEIAVIEAHRLAILNALASTRVSGSGEAL